MMKLRCNVSKRMKCNRTKLLKCQDCQLKSGNNHLSFQGNLLKELLLEAFRSKCVKAPWETSHLCFPTDWSGLPCTSLHTEYYIICNTKRPLGKYSALPVNCSVPPSSCSSPKGIIYMERRDIPGVISQCPETRGFWNFQRNFWILRALWWTDGLISSLFCNVNITWILGLEGNVYTHHKNPCFQPLCPLLRSSPWQPLQPHRVPWLHLGPWILGSGLPPNTKSKVYPYNGILLGDKRYHLLIQQQG